MALVSGLELGRRSEDLLALQLMVDLISGQLGDEDDQNGSSQIVRVVVAGNSLSQDTQDKDSINKVSIGFTLHRVPSADRNRENVRQKSSQGYFDTCSENSHFFFNQICLPNQFGVCHKSCKLAWEICNQTGKIQGILK